MGMKVVKQERVYDIVADGTYIAEIVSYAAKTGTFIDKQGVSKDWHALNFQFVILDEDPTLNGKKVGGQVYAAGKTEDDNLVINPGSPLDKWLTTMGINMDVGSELNLDSLKGKQCTVIVSTTTSVKKGKTQNFSNVTDIKPLSGMMKKAAETLNHKTSAPAVSDHVADVRTASPAPVATKPAVTASRPGSKITF